MRDDLDVNKDALFLNPVSILCDDPDVNKDALFLDPLSNLYDNPDVNKDALFLILRLTAVMTVMLTKTHYFSIL